MTNLERVQLVLEAINSVKSRAKEAASQGDLGTYRTLMGDLTALECSLVIEAQALVDENNKIA